MQLEQSGFRIYKPVLDHIPSVCFIIAATTCLLLMMINTFLVSESHLEGNYEKCWRRYYDLHHPNDTEFVKNMLIKNGGNISEREFENAYSLVNSTSVVKIQMDSSMEENE